MRTFKHLQINRDKASGAVTSRFLRRPGMPKIRLHHEPGTPEFEAEYNAAINGVTKPVPPKGTRAAIDEPETLRWLIERHYRSDDYATMKRRPRCQRRYYLDTLCDVIDDGSGRKLGEMPFVAMTPGIVNKVFRLYRKTPASSGQRVEAIRVLYNWAARVFEDRVIGNPVRNFKRVLANKTGFYFWTDQDRTDFCDHWPVGTKARLWFELTFRLGVRISDVVQLGPQFENRAHNALTWVEMKGSDSESVSEQAPEPKLRKDVPISPKLRKIIDATTVTGLKTYIVGDKGKSIGVERMSELVREWCDAAGLQQCTAHGVRKLGATTLAKSRATERELMAYGNWSNTRTVQVYIDKTSVETHQATVADLLDKVG